MKNLEEENGDCHAHVCRLIRRFFRGIRQRIAGWSNRTKENRPVCFPFVLLV